MDSTFVPVQEDEVFIIEDDVADVKPPSGDVNIIETGDSVKVKQTFDDAITFIFPEDGNLTQNVTGENLKMGIMVISCLIGLATQFYPLEFPANRLILGVGCVSYFILSGLYQYYVFFVERDIICRFKDNEAGKSDELIIVRSTFAKYQEFYFLTLQHHNTNAKAMNINPFKGSEADKSADAKSRQVIGKMYVGNYFTERGEFYEDGFKEDVLSLLVELRKNNYTTIEFNHTKEKRE